MLNCLGAHFRYSIVFEAILFSQEHPSKSSSIDAISDLIVSKVTYLFEPP
jgi:hypothetical protein